MSNTTKKVLGGAMVLSVVGLICKIIGVLFRIPLVYLIGEQGLGLYQLVFPTYNLLLTISSAGIPVAISRMVSHCLARNDPRNAKKVFRAALYILMALGLITTILMIVGSDYCSQRVSDPQTKLGFIAVAPSLFLVCTLSAFRGFMQGQQNMTPTAMSQLIEQLGKLVLSLPFAYWGNQYGGIAYAAAGALLGTSLVEGVALLYMMVLYHKQKTRFEARPQDEGQPELSSKTLGKRIIANAIPITLGACIVPLASFIDSGMLVSRLLESGLNQELARSYYGLYSGVVITLINVPTALAVAISMSMVPAISGALAVNDYRSIERQAKLGLRFSFVIGLPCSIGMSLLATEIINFFYSGAVAADKLSVTASLLSVSSLTVIFFTVVQSTSGILQGLRKQRIPMYTLMAGVAAKIALNYTLVAVPNINIMGAPIASLVCYTVSMVPNLYYVMKYGKMRFDWMGCLVRPGLATAAMGAVVFAAQRLLPAGRLITIGLIVVGVAAYIGFAILFKAITRDDLASFRRRK